MFARQQERINCALGRVVPLCFALVFALSTAPAFAQSETEPDTVSRFIQRLNAEQGATQQLLADLYRLEQDTLAPESDRVHIFFSTRNVDTTGMASIEMSLNNMRVVNHSFSAAERHRLLRRAVQPIYLSRMAPGTYLLNLVVTLESGVKVKTDSIRLVKTARSKFMDFQLEETPERQITVLQW